MHGLLSVPGHPNRPRLFATPLLSSLCLSRLAPEGFLSVCVAASLVRLPDSTLANLWPFVSPWSLSLLGWPYLAVSFCDSALIVTLSLSVLLSLHELYVSPPPPLKHRILCNILPICMQCTKNDGLSPSALRPDQPQSDKQDHQSITSTPQTRLITPDRWSTQCHLSLPPPLPPTYPATTDVHYNATATPHSPHPPPACEPFAPLPPPPTTQQSKCQLPTLDDPQRRRMRKHEIPNSSSPSPPSPTGNRRKHVSP